MFNFNKRLLALALIAGIPAATTHLSIVHPALAAPAQTLTPSNSIVQFPTHAFGGKTRLCARTLDGKTGFLRLQAGFLSETMQVAPQETCIERQWGGVLLNVSILPFTTKSQSIRVFTS